MKTDQFVRAYSIKEVSKKINIPAGTIRQWEKDLEGIITIPRTRQGARYYTDKEIELLKKIKEMRKQNISKEMIRTLLQKYLSTNDQNENKKGELTVLPTLEKKKQQSSTTPTIQTEQLYPLIHHFKQQILQEIKTEMSRKQTEMLNDIKAELASSSLHTIKALSKSVQRSNKKRVKEVEELKDTILATSEHHSETLETLKQDVAKHSEDGFEQLSQKIEQNVNSLVLNNESILNHMFNTVAEAKNEVKELAETIDIRQEELIDRMEELRETTEEIQHREEIFQEMLTNFREAAATKARRKWWKIFF